MKCGFDLTEKLVKMRAAAYSQCFRKDAETKIHYYIDSIKTLNDETVITGWVFCSDKEVDISLLHCEEYQLKRIVRSDVVSQYASKIKVNLKCGFEIRASQIDFSHDLLKFSIATNEKVVKIKESGIRSNKSMPMCAAYVNYHNALYWISYLSRYGFKATMKKNKPEKPEEDVYKDWYEAHRATKLDLKSQKKYKFGFTPLISILVPVFSTPEVYLREMIQSVQDQTYANWELCIADGSPDNDLYKILQEISKTEPRLKLKKIAENKGISGNTNEALSLAQGEYVAFLDHDDLLTPDALYEVVKVLNKAEEIVDLVYSDEDKTNETSSKFFKPHFKPDFSLDFLRTNNYICHFTTIRKALLEENNICFASKYDGAQDYDVIIRCVERAKSIKHIPRILYHWRAFPGSTSGTCDAKPYTHEAGRRVLQDHLARCGIKGDVLDGGFFGGLSNLYHIHYESSVTPQISIIIPNCNQEKLLEDCINSILEKTNYNNYEITVVENNSTEKGIFAYDKKLKNHKKIRISKWQGEFNHAAISNYAAPHNYAIKQCCGEYFVFFEQ